MKNDNYYVAVYMRPLAAVHLSVDLAEVIDIKLKNRIIPIPSFPLLEEPLRSKVQAMYDTARFKGVSIMAAYKVDKHLNILGCEFT